MSVYIFMCILYLCTKQEYISILTYFSHQEIVGEGPDLGQLVQRLQVDVLITTLNMTNDVYDKIYTAFPVTSLRLFFVGQGNRIIDFGRILVCLSYLSMAFHHFVTIAE